MYNDHFDYCLKFEKKTMPGWSPCIVNTNFFKWTLRNGNKENA